MSVLQFFQIFHTSLSDPILHILLNPYILGPDVYTFTYLQLMYAVF